MKTRPSAKMTKTNSTLASRAAGSAFLGLGRPRKPPSSLQLHRRAEGSVRLCRLLRVVGCGVTTDHHRA